MATTLKPNLVIGLGLNKLGLDKGLSDVKRDLQGLDKTAQSTTGTFGKLRKAIGGVFGQALGVAGGLGLFRLIQQIGGGLQSLVTESLKFNEQMANVNSVAQYGQKAFAQLTDSVLQLAEDPRITDLPAVLAAGLYTLVSSGYSAADSMIILKAAAIGATAGMSTTAVAADVLASTLGAYGKTAADATATMNTLFQIVNISKYTFDQLASSLSSVTPSAASLGVTLDEVGAAMATMGKQGTDAQRATVQLNAVLTALLKPTDEMTAVLAANGYASGQAAIEALGFSGVLELLEKAIAGNDTEAAALFKDVRALRGILQLTTQDGALYNENLDAMSHAQDGAGATAKALAEQMKSALFQLRLLHKNVVLFFTEGIGNGFSRSIAKAISYVNHFFDSFFRARRRGLSFFASIFKGIRSAILKALGRKTYDEIRPVLDKIQKVLALIGNAIGAVVRQIIPFIKFWIWLIYTIQKFILTGGLTAILIRNLAKRFVPLARILHFIGYAVRLVISAVVPFIKYIWAVITGTKPLSAALLKIPHPLIWIAYLLGRLVKTLRVFFKTWQDKGFLAALAKIPNQIKAFGNALAGLLYQLAGSQKVNAFILKLFDDLATAFRHLVYLVRDLVNGDWAKAWKDFGVVADNGKKILGEVLSGIWIVVKWAFDQIPWRTIGDALWTETQAAFAFLTGEAIPWLSDKIQSLIKKAWNSIDWKKLGSTIWSGLKSTLRYTNGQALSWLIKTSEKLLEDAWTAVNWKKIGSNILSGLKKSFDYIVNHPETLAVGAGLVGLAIWGPIGGLIAGAIALGVIGNRSKVLTAVEKAFDKFILEPTISFLGDIPDMINDFGGFIRKSIRWTTDKEVDVPGLILNTSVKVKDKSGTGGKHRTFFQSFIHDIYTAGAAVRKASIWFINHVTYALGYGLGVALGALLTVLAGIVYGIIYVILHPFKSLDFAFKSIIWSVRKAGDNLKVFFGFFIRFWTGVWTGLGDAIPKGLKNGLENAWGRLKGWITDKFNQFISWVKGVLGISSPSKVFAEIGSDLIAGLVQGMSDALNSLWTWISNNLSPTAIGSHLGDWFGSASEWGASLIDGAISGFIGAIGRLQTWLTTNLSPSALASHIGNWYNSALEWGTSLLQGAYDGATAYWTSTLQPWLAGFSGDISDSIGDLKTTLAGKGEDLIDGLRHGAQDIWNNYVGPWIGNFPGMIYNAAGDVYGAGVGLGSSIVTGIWNGVAGLWGWLQNKLLDLYNSLPGPLRKVLQAASPSKLFAKIGATIPQGIVVGVQKGFADVNSVMAHLGALTAAEMTTTNGSSSSRNRSVVPSPMMSTAISAGGALGSSSFVINNHFPEGVTDPEQLAELSARKTVAALRRLRAARA